MKSDFTAFALKLYDELQLKRNEHEKVQHDLVKEQRKASK